MKKDIFVKGNEFMMLEYSKNLLNALQKVGVKNFERYDEAMRGLSLFEDDNYKVDGEVKLLIEPKGIYTAMQLSEKEYLKLRDSHTKLESLKRCDVENFKGYNEAKEIVENEQGVNC
jgi:hypothetical protein